MQSISYQREIRGDGAILLSSTEATFAFRRPRQGALLVTIEGRDRGQFGPGAIDEIGAWLCRNRPVELFIDAREVIGVTVAVQDEWSRFFASNRDGLAAVHILAGSPAMRLTIAIASHFSRTGSLIHLHDHSASFARQLRKHDVSRLG